MMRRAGFAAFTLVLGLAFGAGAEAQTRPAAKHDTKQPIDISSDSLEVEQDKQIATFRGNVDALQGDLRLKADTLIVHYRNKADSPPAAQPPPKTAAKGSAAGAAASADADPFAGGSISRIDANGHVFVSSPEESGRGDTGYYDVDKRVIVLEGSQVVLTRGQNVLRGNRAVMNLDTGRSTLDVAPGQRVHGLFVPEQNSGQGGMQGGGQTGNQSGTRSGQR
ncbi:MAG TPA: LptA/OstA family protein [Candidatus Cybelea sp.]|nr:LptA/OstA family protein [Candidatus Cybelea sp.]